MEIEIVRLGHRVVRDYRVTTHVCLVSRALGAKRIWIEGSSDNTVQTSLDQIAKEWGPGFEVQFTVAPRKTVNDLKKKGFCIVHLTMYGKPIQEAEEEIGSKPKVAILIGSQKVPPEYYQMADYNISVTGQPHSEIGALAIALDRISGGKGLATVFPDAKRKVESSIRGKKLRREG